MDEYGAVTLEQCPRVEELKLKIKSKGLQFFLVFNFTPATRGYFPIRTPHFSSIDNSSKSIILMSERWSIKRIMKQNVKNVSLTVFICEQSIGKKVVNSLAF